MARDGGDDSTCGLRGIETGINRRSYLKLAGAAAGSLAVASGQASAAFERGGIRFNRRVNMVEAGCDPTGSEPCDEAFQRVAESEDADNTLLEFPPGTYHFEGKNTILGRSNFGMRGLGDRGDVRFMVPPNYNRKLLVIDVLTAGGSGLLFENIDIDLTAPGATPAIHFGTDDNLVIRDVRFYGEGIGPESEPIKSGRSVDNTNPDVRNALFPIVRDPAGTGVVENFVAHNRGLLGTYTRTGVWVGKSNKGTVTLRDCDVEGFPGNGLYCSRTNGVVQVEGGTFKNNDISQVRIGSEGSYVKDATIAADLQNGRSPNPQDALNTRGVRLESGGPGEARGGTVENCDITIASTPNSSGAVVAARTHGDFTITDSRIRVDVDRIRGVHAKVPDGGLYDEPVEPRAATIRGVEITGSAERTEAIRLVGRDGSTVENSCIHQFGRSRDGIRVVNAAECAVRDTTFDVAGRPIVERNARVERSGNRSNGSCSVPTLPNTLEIGGNGSYEIALNAVAHPTSNPDAATRTISGSPSGGTDVYRFAGYATAIDLTGNITLRRNGVEIAPIDLYPSTVVIDGRGAGRRLDYEFTVDTALERRTVDGARANSEDEIDGDTARGAVQGGRDGYTFAGDITFEVLDLGADVIVNGREIDTGPPAIRPNGQLPGDPDGDGRYEDINGDGSTNVVDVQALFANRGRDRVRNTVAFDFTGDGTVDVVDIQRLFSEIA